MKSKYAMYRIVTIGLLLASLVGSAILLVSVGQSLLARPTGSAVTVKFEREPPAVPATISPALPQGQQAALSDLTNP